MGENKEKTSMRLFNVNQLKEDMGIVVKCTNSVNNILKKLKEDGTIYLEDIDSCINKLHDIEEYCEGIIEDDDLKKINLSVFTTFDKDK